MNEENIVNKMLAKYSELTKAQRRVADYVLAHKTETQYMTISDLAGKCKVAESTLTYFCKALDSSGFNDFKLSLAKSTLIGQNANEGFAFDDDIQLDDSIESMCQKLYSYNNDALSQTMAVIDPKAVTRAIDTFIKSENVYCFGQGVSSIMAYEAWGRFSTVASKFHWVQETHLQTMTCSLLDENSAILYFSYSGATRELIEMCKLAAAVHVPIVLVTRFPNAPAVIFADTVLLCSCDEGPLNPGSIAAKIAQLFVVDVLFNEFCRRDPQNFLKRKEKTTSAVAQRLL